MINLNFNKKEIYSDRKNNDRINFNVLIFY
jgi:hypothetical protein